KFFAAVESKCDFKKGREFRVREADLVRDTITGRLTTLHPRTADLVKRNEGEVLKAELQEYGRRILDARAAVGAFLDQSAREHVYWVERTGKRGQFFTLNA